MLRKAEGPKRGEVAKRFKELRKRLGVMSTAPQARHRIQLADLADASVTT